jgi:hypothetical protein
MMFSENRYPSRIKCGTGFFGIMLGARAAMLRESNVSNGETLADNSAENLTAPWLLLLDRRRHDTKT